MIWLQGKKKEMKKKTKEGNLELFFFQISLQALMFMCITSAFLCKLYILIIVESLNPSGVDYPHKVVCCFYYIYTEACNTVERVLCLPFSGFYCLLLMCYSNAFLFGKVTTKPKRRKKKIVQFLFCSRYHNVLV